jgi:hypothetical protein
MSPTRKPKPPDKGAPPEHKPSRKVALEEVMRSLQDLVSNELATDPAGSPGEAQTAAAKPKKPVPAEKLPATRSAYSADVLPTTPIEPDSISLDHAHPAQPPSATPDVGNELPDINTESLSAAVAPPAAMGSAVPAEGLQQELPYLEEISPAPSANPPAPTPEAAEFQMAELPPEELPPVEVNDDINRDNNIPPTSSTPEAAPAPDEAMNWDDIPVLEEAVELAEEIDADGASTPPATLLPSADAAHRLAIQVAARLNVELRKSGQGGLNSDVITRLARLLQEALAKGAPNMENNPSNKH